MLAFAQRFLLSTAGPAGVAAANFAVSFLLLACVPAANFGLYAFAMVLVGIGCGLSNAAFGSPLMIALNRDERAPAGAAESFAFANAIASLSGGGVTMAVLLALGAGRETSLAFAVAAFLLWVRWFGRALEYARRRPARVAASDIASSVALLAGVLLAWRSQGLNLYTAAVIQGIASLIGVLALGADIVAVHARGLMRRATAPFMDGFMRHGRHALLGVVSTEATANAHSYVVTLMLGPAAFAPLAAAALFFRPIGVVLQTLGQLERPALAGMLRTGDRPLAWHTVSLIRMAALGTWAGSVILAFVVVRWFLDDLVHEAHDPSQIAAAVVLWAAISGLECLRGPESTLVQADGLFRPLAMAMVYSGLITLPLAAVLAYTHGPVWSLVGVLVGQLVATTSVILLARKTVAMA